MTRNLIRIKAKAMASDQQISDFQASNSWCTRFLRRRNFVLRQKTKIAQKLPEDLEEKITSFHRFVIKRRKETNYELVHIGNMDETQFGLTCLWQELLMLGERELCWLTQLVMKSLVSLLSCYALRMAQN